LVGRFRPKGRDEGNGTPTYHRWRKKTRKRGKVNRGKHSQQGEEGEAVHAAADGGRSRRKSNVVQDGQGARRKSKV